MEYTFDTPVTTAELKAARSELFASGELEIAALGAPRVVQKALDLRVEKAIADFVAYTYGDSPLREGRLDDLLDAWRAVS